MIDIGDAEVRVEALGPRLDSLPGDGGMVYRWFKDDAHTINGHSVVLRLEYKETSVLLAGDLNTEGAKHLLEDAAMRAKLDAHVLKAPHHGSQDYYPPFLDAVRPQISVISSGDEPDHGHPRAAFIGAVGHASRSGTPLIFSTEIAATFVEAGETSDLEDGGSGLERRDARDNAALGLMRELFKRRLHGMINLRSDGRRLYTARRVNAGYWWEAYGPIEAASRQV